MLKTKKAHKEFFRGRMKPGYWSLYLFGHEMKFDVRQYICEVESGEICIDRCQTWYKVLKYDVEHGVYDKTLWSWAYYCFNMLFRNMDYWLHKVSHGILFPFDEYPSVTGDGNEFILIALTYGHARYPKHLRMTLDGDPCVFDEIDEVYGGILW